MAQSLGDDSGTDAQNAGDPILPSPKANNGISFPVGIATKDTAVTSAALSAAPETGGSGCSPLNPCAVVTPALSDVSSNPDAPPPVRRAQRKRNTPVQTG